MAKRKLTVKIENASGTTNRVLAWVNGYPIIHTDGQDGEWSGKIPAGKVKLETAVWGQGKAKYALTIDLPGTIDDQKIECSLTKGYYDAEYSI
jgi:hypothetical protein